MNVIFKSKLILLALLGTLVLGGCTGEEKTLQPTNSPVTPQDQPQPVPETEPVVSVSERKLVLSPSVQQDGSLLVELDGMGDSYNFYVKASVELQDRIYQYLHVFYDDHNLTDALVAIDPVSGMTDIELVQTVSGSDHPGYNFFINNSVLSAS